MPNDETEFSEEEVTRLVSQAAEYIGRVLQEGAHNSVSVEGARHLGRYAVAELKALNEQIYGKDGEDPNPVMRQHRLKELRRRFPATPA